MRTARATLVRRITGKDARISPRAAPTTDHTHGWRSGHDELAEAPAGGPMVRMRVAMGRRIPTRPRTVSQSGAARDGKRTLRVSGTHIAHMYMLYEKRVTATDSGWMLRAAAVVDRLAQKTTAQAYQRAIRF